jgi:hypothetical protein
LNSNKSVVATDSNKIRRLNARTFITLNHLLWVNLGSNVCVNLSFRDGDAALLNVIQNIPRSCAFCEFDKTCLPFVESLKEEKDKFQKQVESLRITIAVKDKIVTEQRKEIDAKLVKIFLLNSAMEKLEAENEAKRIVIAEKDQTIAEKDKTIADQTGEIAEKEKTVANQQNQIDAKLVEISRLSADLIRVTVKNEAKKIIIERYEKNCML